MNQLSLVPACDKHGCEKVWIKDRQKKAGGQWRCLPCAAERARNRYHASGGEVLKLCLERKKKAAALRRAALMPKSCACGTSINQGDDGSNRWKEKCDECAASARRIASKRCRASDLDRYRAVQRAYNDAHREDQLRWRTENRDRVRANGVAYRQKNGAELREKSRLFYQQNKELFFSGNALRRARCRKSYEQLDAVDKAIIRAIYRKSRAMGLAVDHIQPLFLGGGHVPWNMQLLTREQNSSKFCRQPVLGEVLRGERRYRLLRRVFERELGAVTS